ncbi:hypothetical protein MT325_M584R [Paramecium bursaria chlorella virus MT325]|uniref:Uncharacterized protein M584R n=1 Tax=Paramecium bursaria Chlorella virus MT325 TaxID=346932 RepID=A7IUW4_PBCVM|nr:hypothetical protein MT325_M584R [Paramecium bursaria chlorella virus MT325]
MMTLDKFYTVIISLEKTGRRVDMVVAFWQHTWYCWLHSTFHAFIVRVLLRVVHWNHRIPYSIFHSGICIPLDVSKQCSDISTVSIFLSQKKGFKRFLDVFNV